MIVLSRCLELLISKTDNLTPKDFEVTTNEGRTAMHYAAKHGRLSRVQTLISVSNENVRDIKGQTPLHLAAKFGHEHVIELILRNSPRALVDPLSLLYEVDNDGRNPLHLAAHSSNVGVKKIDHGSPVIYNFNIILNVTGLPEADYSRYKRVFFHR